MGDSLDHLNESGINTCTKKDQDGEAKTTLSGEKDGYPKEPRDAETTSPSARFSPGSFAREQSPRKSAKEICQTSSICAAYYAADCLANCAADCATDCATNSAANSAANCATDCAANCATGCAVNCTAGTAQHELEQPSCFTANQQVVTVCFESCSPSEVNSPEEPRCKAPGEVGLSSTPGMSAPSAPAGGGSFLDNLAEADNPTAAGADLAGLNPRDMPSEQKNAAARSLEDEFHATDHQETADDISDKCDESTTVADPVSDDDDTSCKDVTGGLPRSVDPPCTLSYTMPVFGQDSSLGRKASERAASWLRGQKMGSSEYSESDGTSAGSSTFNAKSVESPSKVQAADASPGIFTPMADGREAEDPNALTTDTDLMQNISSAKVGDSAVEPKNALMFPENTEEKADADLQEDPLAYMPETVSTMRSSSKPVLVECDIEQGLSQATDAPIVQEQWMSLEKNVSVMKRRSSPRKLEGSLHVRPSKPHWMPQIIMSTRFGVATLVNTIEVEDEEEIQHPEAIQDLEKAKDTAQYFDPCLESAQVKCDPESVLLIKENPTASGALSCLNQPSHDEHATEDTPKQTLPDVQAADQVASYEPVPIKPILHLDRNAAIQRSADFSESCYDEDPGNDPEADAEAEETTSSELSSDPTKSDDLTTKTTSEQVTSTAGHEPTSDFSTSNPTMASKHAVSCKQHSTSSDHVTRTSVTRDDEESSSSVLEDTETVTESSYATTTETEHNSKCIPLLLTVPKPKPQENKPVGEDLVNTSSHVDASTDDDESETETFSGTYTYTTTFSSKAMSHLPCDVKNDQESDDTTTSAQDAACKLTNQEPPPILERTSLKPAVQGQDLALEESNEGGDACLSRMSIQDIGRDSDDEELDIDKSLEATYPFSHHKQSLSNMESTSHLTVPPTATCRADLHAAREKFFLGPDIPPEGAVTVSSPGIAPIHLGTAPLAVSEETYPVENTVESADQSTEQTTMLTEDETEMSYMDASETVTMESFKERLPLPPPKCEDQQASGNEIFKKVSFSDVLVTKAKRRKVQDVPMQSSNIKGILKPPSCGTTSPGTRGISRSNSTESLGWDDLDNGGKLTRPSKPPAPIDPDSLRSESLEMLHKRRRGFFTRLFGFGASKPKKKMRKISDDDRDIGPDSLACRKLGPRASLEKNACHDEAVSRSSQKGKTEKKHGFLKRLFGKKKVSPDADDQPSKNTLKFVNIEVHQNFIELPSSTPAQMGLFQDAAQAGHTWPRRVSMSLAPTLPQHPSTGRTQTLPSLAKYGPVKRATSGGDRLAERVDLESPDHFYGRNYHVRPSATGTLTDGDSLVMMHSSAQSPIPSTPAMIQQALTQHAARTPESTHEFRIPPGFVLGEDYAAGEPPTGIGQWPGEPWINYPSGQQCRMHQSTDSMRPEVGSNPQTTGSTSCSSSLVSAGSRSPSVPRNVEMAVPSLELASRGSSELRTEVKSKKRSLSGSLFRRLSIRARNEAASQLTDHDSCICTCDSGGSNSHGSSCKLVAGLEPSQKTVGVNSRMRAGVM